MAWFICLVKYIYKCILYLSANKIVHFILIVKYIDLIINGVMKAFVSIERFLFFYVYKTKDNIINDYFLRMLIFCFTIH